MQSLREESKLQGTGQSAGVRREDQDGLTHKNVRWRTWGWERREKRKEKRKTKKEKGKRKKEKGKRKKEKEKGKKERGRELDDILPRGKPRSKPARVDQVSLGVE